MLQSGTMALAVFQMVTTLLSIKGRPVNIKSFGFHDTTTNGQATDLALSTRVTSTLRLLALLRETLRIGIDELQHDAVARYPM